VYMELLCSLDCTADLHVQLGKKCPSSFLSNCRMVGLNNVLISMTRLQFGYNIGKL
jgi:hypothetical protein